MSASERERRIDEALLDEAQRDRLEANRPPPRGESDLQRDLREAIAASAMAARLDKVYGAELVEKSRHLEYARAAREVPDRHADWPLRTREGAWAAVVKAWGIDRASCYLAPLKSALDEARGLATWRKKRARLTCAQEKLVSTFNRTYGPEIIFQRVLCEAAERDPELNRVLDPRSAYLLAVARGVADPPRNAKELRTALKRWAERVSKKSRQKGPVSDSRRGARRE